MRYNRYCLRLWIRCWSSPYLFSLILSLTIEIYFSPINKLHSVPQICIPIFIEMFVAFSFRFLLILRCSTFAFFFIRNWHVPSIVTKTYEIVISRIIKFWHIISWWSWWESHPCLIRYPLRSSNKFLYICKYLYYPFLLKWYALHTLRSSST